MRQHLRWARSPRGEVDGLLVQLKTTKNEYFYRHFDEKWRFFAVFAEVYKNETNCLQIIHNISCPKVLIFCLILCIIVMRRGEKTHESD